VRHDRTEGRKISCHRRVAAPGPALDALIIHTAHQSRRHVRTQAETRQRRDDRRLVLDRQRSSPTGARSLALMMEDPDATSARPFVHWLAWNVDPAAGDLPEGIQPAGGAVAGLRQGRTSRDSVGYFGPRPHGSSPHHYHFQLFALDASLDLADGADREALLAAMAGHVLAKGDLVGLFAQPRG